MAINRSEVKPKKKKKSEASESQSHYEVFEKSKTSQIRIEQSEYKGKQFVNLREFKNWEGEGGDFRPTKAGFTVSPDDYRAFAKAVVRFGKEMGYIPKKKK